MWRRLFVLRLKDCEQRLLDQLFGGVQVRRFGLIFGGFLLLLFLSSTAACSLWVGRRLLSLGSAGYGWLYFGLLGLAVFLISLMLDTAIGRGIFSEDWEDELLRAMPIRPRDRLLSRVAELYLIALCYSCGGLLPAFLLYARAFGAGIMQWLAILLLPLLLPLMTASLGALFGYRITARQKSVPRSAMKLDLPAGILILALVAAFFLLLFHIWRRAAGFIGTVVVNASGVAAVLGGALSPVYRFGMALCAGDMPGLGYTRCSHYRHSG